MCSAKNIRDEVIRGWSCSTCSALITTVEDGWVEWLAVEEAQGTTALTGLRLVHGLAAFPGAAGGHGCRYDFRLEFRKNRSIVEGLPLERFVGPNGLMLLLAFIAADELPRPDVIELAKRVQIPGYEQTRQLLGTNASGIVSPQLEMEKAFVR